VDRFESMVALLRRGQAAEAERLWADEPDRGRWLPRWTAGEELSSVLRQARWLNDLIRGVAIDDAYGWVMTSRAVHRIPRDGGNVQRLGLEGPDEFHYESALVGDTVVAVTDERLLVWDLATGKMVLATDPDDVPRRAGGLRSLAVHDGVAVTGTEGGYLLLWDLADGGVLARTKAHGGDTSCVAISTEGRRSW
jgi:hypothetical protein